MIERDPLIGKQLANFLIERVLGRGGMAQVYYGLDVKLQRPVAIKVIDARYRNKPSYAQRFVKEARSVAKWRHENIIQIYYADDADELYYYVMEYIGGHDLSSVMSSYTNRGELMPAADVLRIGGAVASALDYAHKKGVIHRDVKPSNVLMSDDGRVVLGDFGLALDMQEGSSGEIFGTPHYISPEQARRSKDVVPQSDIYSLGVILYEMLTGVVPFDDASPTSVALQHITQPPPPPRSINPLISEQTETVILKALAKKPEDRYQSGAELMEALEKALTASEEEAQKEKILPLPPIPAAIISGQAPTMFQAPSNQEIEELEAAAAASKTPEVLPTQPTQRKRMNWLGLGAGALGLIVLLALGLYFFYPQVFPAALTGFASPSPQPITTVAASATLEPATPAPSPTPTNSVGASSTVAASATAENLPLGSAPTLTVTPTASSAATATEIPSASPTLPEASPTLSSETPTATITPIPTETATGEASTSTPAPSPGAIATVKYPNGKRFMMLYDVRGIYIINLSDKSRPLESFAFDRINDDGQLSNHFDGWRWSQFYPIIYPQNCIKIEMTKQEDYPGRPSECVNRTLGGRFYDKGSEFFFWTPQDGSHFFRVTWKKEEIAQCEIARGACEVFVP